MHVPDILNEILNRLKVSDEIQERSVESPDKIKESIKESKVYEKESTWVIVGTLQIIWKRFQKISKEEKKSWLISLLLLSTLRFKASEQEHTMYYKLLLSLMRECFKDKNADCMFVDATLPIKMWFNTLTLSTDPKLYILMFKFIEDIVINWLRSKKVNELVHSVLVWYSDLNRTNDLENTLNGTIFEKIYESNPDMLSTNYCQSIDLFLANFRVETENINSNKLVSYIFNNILQALVKPSKSLCFAKIWNELFKWLAIIGSNDESVDRFVSTFLSLPDDIQDNLFTHFEIDNVSLDSTKK